MARVVKESGSIVTIAGNPTLEEIRRIGGTAWILKVFLKRKEKRKEFKAAKSVNATVFSFEPSIFNLELLGRNICNNKVDKNISIVPIVFSIYSTVF